MAIDRNEDTPELTGAEAGACEADAGSAGDGASPWGADMTGCSPEELAARIEAEPGDPLDIRPDKIAQGFAEKSLSDEDEEITARPKERVHAIPPDELPEG